MAIYIGYADPWFIQVHVIAIVSSFQTVVNAIDQL